ncbi:hypothetical protein M231_02596 [Tremella mesenterica]|uniref:4-hydroxy-4-methyl-2-oxoglutarate aldolase n=1 Tax=Tremella mesenterica TaxID=5217 RepID=A0A4Q1BQD4_TREME|nr:hypothetical protein M231_02596 [Tremella mesenterica]
MSPNEILTSLSQLATCDLSDAMVKMGIPTGGLLPDLHSYSPAIDTGRLIGQAFTVKMVPTADPGLKPTEHFVDACPEGRVMVLLQPPGMKNAIWGGLMSTGAKQKGVKGLIVIGGIRDLAENRDLGFPIWAKYHSTLGSATFTRSSQLDVPLEIPFDGEISTIVKPGDWVVGDEDGVVIVPQDKAEEVVLRAQKGKEADENIRAELERGAGMGESIKKFRG